MWWQVQSRHRTPVSLAEEDSGTLPGAEFWFWFVADMWLAFFSIALLREELVPYLLYYYTWTMYFDMKYGMNGIYYLSYICLFYSVLPLTGHLFSVSRASAGTFTVSHGRP